MRLLFSRFNLSSSLLYFLFVCCSFCVAQQSDVTSGLTLPTSSEPTVVRTAFHLINITSIDDEAETFGFAGILTLRWKDPRQAFDPKQVGVSEKVYQGNFQYNELSPSWFPQVLLANSAGTFNVNGVTLRVKPDGFCTLVQSVDAVVKTQLNMRRYPFDIQRLEIIFEVLGFDNTEVLLEAETNGSASIKDTARISQWEIIAIGLAAELDSVPGSDGLKTNSQLVVTIDAERHSFFTIRLVVFPLILIVMLSWSVFWMERSSLGDRISVSFIGILTAVAYQIVLGDILPHISYVTLINGFLNISLLIMCATVAVNLYVGSCDKRGKSLQGDLIDQRCRWIFPLVYFTLVLLITLIAFIFF